VQNWTKKSLVVAAAGGLLIAGVGSALAGENGSESTTNTTALSVQVGAQVPWAVDGDASTSEAATAYREMLTQVRAAAKNLDSGGYLSVDVALNGASDSTVQMIVRASDFAVTGWVDPASNEFVALNSDSPTVLVGPPRAPVPPPNNNQNNGQNQNQNNNQNNQNQNQNNQNNQNNGQNNQNNNNGQNNNQNPPPPVQCFDRNGIRINQNDPQCAPTNNPPAPAQRRDAGIRVANPLAATASASTAEVKLSFDDLVGAFTSLLQSGTSVVDDLSDAVSTIVQVITGGASSTTVETAVSDALQS